MTGPEFERCSSCGLRTGLCVLCFDIVIAQRVVWDLLENQRGRNLLSYLLSWGAARGDPWTVCLLSNFWTSEGNASMEEEGGDAFSPVAGCKAGFGSTVSSVPWGHLSLDNRVTFVDVFRSPREPEPRMGKGPEGQGITPGLL